MARAVSFVEVRVDHGVGHDDGVGWHGAQTTTFVPSSSTTTDGSFVYETIFDSLQEPTLQSNPIALLITSLTHPSVDPPDQARK